MPEITPTPTPSRFECHLPDVGSYYVKVKNSVAKYLGKAKNLMFIDPLCYNRTPLPTKTPTNSITPTPSKTPSIYGSWVQIGQEIDGEAANDYSGWSVSMNAAGDIVAIGATYNDSTSGVNAGHVRVYSYNGTLWVQLGQDINGEAAADLSGWSVSMNAAGDRVVIGAPYNDENGLSSGHVRVYSYNGTSWVQLGQDINGEAAGDQSGYSVSMNAAGDIVAIGATYNDGTGLSAGHVRAYFYNGTSWTQLGQDIDGEAANDYSGWSVSMNAAGDIVAIGAPYNDENGADSGHVRVYSYNGTSWTQLGQDINGKAAGGRFGHSVAINASGDRVVIGAPYYDSSTTIVDSGYVRVYSYNGTSWVQLGQELSSINSGSNTMRGWSVSINAAGTRIVFSEPSPTTSTAGGNALVYFYNGSTWVTSTSFFNNLGGSSPGTQLGYSVSMNAAGDSVAAGAIYRSHESVSKLGRVIVNRYGIASNSIPIKVTASEDGTVIMAVTAEINNAKLAISRNRGISWITTDANILANNNNDTYNLNIACSSDGRVQVVSSYLRLAVSEDYGVTWFERTPPSQYQSLGSLWLSLDGTIIYIVVSTTSTSHIILESTNTGVTWLAKTSPQHTSSYAPRIAASNDGQKVVAVYPTLYSTPIAYGDIYTSTDRANTWVKRNQSGDYNYVVCDDSGTKIVAAYLNSGSLKISSNSGSTWTAKSVVPSIYGQIDSFCMSSNGSVIYATPFLYKSTDGGATFSLFSTTSFRIPTNRYGMKCNSDGSIVTIATSRVIMQSRDGGISWKTVKPILFQ